MSKIRRRSSLQVTLNIIQTYNFIFKDFDHFKRVVLIQIRSPRILAKWVSQIGRSLEASGLAEP